GNFALAVFDQGAAFRLVSNTEGLRDFDVTLELSVYNFSIRREQSVSYPAHRRHDDNNGRTLVFTHDLNGAFECGCIADGGSAELEYPHSWKRKLKLNLVKPAGRGGEVLSN